MAYLIHFSTPATPTVEKFSDIHAARAAAEALTTAGPRYILTEITSKSLSVLTGSNLSVLYTKLCGIPKSEQPRMRNVSDLIDQLLTIIPERARVSALNTPKRSTKMATTEKEVTETPKAAKGKRSTKAAPVETPATKASKAAPAPKAATKGKKAAAPAETNGGGRGRPSALAGKKLYRVKGSETLARMRADSRRAVSLSKIKDGMTFEAALAAGAEKGDIDTMIKLGTLSSK